MPAVFELGGAVGMQEFVQPGGAAFDHDTGEIGLNRIPVTARRRSEKPGIPAKQTKRRAR
jgi:hypothetical protein